MNGGRMLEVVLSALAPAMALSRGDNDEDAVVPGEDEPSLGETIF